MGLNNKIVIIVQARVGSTRLPGKVLLPILGKPVLIRQLERMKFARLPHSIIVATTTEPEDDTIENLCRSEGYKYFRGSPDNLLDRHYRCAVEAGADVIIKIPSDCPLIDPNVIDKVIQFYIDNSEKYDYVSNLHPSSYPDGNDVEVIPMQILELAHTGAFKDYELEHTTPLIWDNPDRFRIGNVLWDRYEANGLDLSMTHRFTIDYAEDYVFIKTIYDNLYPKNNLFGLDDILLLLEQQPDIMKINDKYAGVNWYRHKIGKLKTIGMNQTRLI